MISEINFIFLHFRLIIATFCNIHRLLLLPSYNTTYETLVECYIDFLFSLFISIFLLVIFNNEYIILLNLNN